MTDTIAQPTVDEIRAARAESHLSRAEAAALVHLGHSVRWAEYELGTRQMDVARWELFLLKTGQHPELKASRRRVAA